ncbi:MAG: Hsp20/alpha crystallin family protein [Dechloromonas sp.]|nr:MAG: Hsp20/alpha crystallin family protein [Dechloromonas sp.]
MNLESMKESVESLWNSLAEGWQHLRQSAATALTHFKPGSDSSMPSAKEVDDQAYLPTRGWAMLGGDVFEDDKRLVVRLEVPGMEKQDFDIEVFDGRLVVSGEKRFQRESSAGRWQVVQCAYGAFRREIPLSARVALDEARASYNNGVLRIELRKLEPGRPRSLTIPVE